MLRVVTVLVLLGGCVSDGTSEPPSGNQKCFAVTTWTNMTITQCAPGTTSCIEFCQRVPTFCGDCFGTGCDCVDGDYCTDWEPWDPYDPSSPTPSESDTGCN